MTPDKLHPRNRTARLAKTRAAGNAVVTELESGVGNCFPGLEFDARNLDRRFFPYLVVDFTAPGIVVTEVALERAQTDGADTAFLQKLNAAAQGLAGGWSIATLHGQFVGYGERELDINRLGATTDDPIDAWTAVRLLLPGTDITVTLRSGDGGQGPQLTAQRASYLHDDGAFAAMFEPGELTQSLCSPWTHDFRDCGCFYWASNHPDIVQPAIPAAAAAADPDYAVQVPWLRQDRVPTPPPANPDHAAELRHHEINHRWRELEVVLDGREQRMPYSPEVVQATPLEDDKLVPTLRYAAGVEHAVLLEYLAAAYSLNLSVDDGVLRDDVVVAHYEVLRVAQSEMRHLKMVNGLLLGEHQRGEQDTEFQPTLGVATIVPGLDGTRIPSMNFRRLTAQTLVDFIRIEAPSQSIDALYGRILATYQRDGRQTEFTTVSQVMAEGADHYSTFLVVQELLQRHSESDYLLDLRTPQADDPALDDLHERYQSMLDRFFAGYSLGLPEGRDAILAAHGFMQGGTGVEGACEDLAAAGVLPVFVLPDDDRFAPVSPPEP